MPNRNVGGQYRYAYQGQEKDPETGMEAFALRLWDARIGRWLTTDPAGQFHSPYLGMGNNPISRVDPDGGFSPPSTHLDENGNVIAVYNDGDLGVYIHTNEELASMGGIFGGNFNPETMSLAVTGNTSRIGETQFWNEFISPETGFAVGRIDIGASWNNLLARLHTRALDMDLREIAANSTKNKVFDVKANKDYAPYGGFTGKLLNGKYASARSAGNYLAGYNGSTGTYFGSRISWDTYIKMAGAVHQGQWSKTNATKILLFGKSYGKSPWYGEIEYAGRQIQQGWNHLGFKN